MPEPQNTDGERYRNEERPFRWVQEHWKPVGITVFFSVGAGLLAWVGILSAMLSWGDERYIRRVEAMTIAAAKELTEAVEKVSDEGKSNSKKLDFLLTQAAQREVYDAEVALKQLKDNPQQTLEYHDAKRDAVKRLDTAEVTLDCLRGGGNDCEKHRSW